MGEPTETPPTVDGQVTLVRPDGSLFSTSKEEAGGFQTLGYKPESPEEFTARNVQQGKEDYWTSPSQKFYTGLEGVESGLTFGASDYLLNKAGATDFQERARYNPGTRLGTEVAGAILPTILDPASALGRSPAGALMKGADEVANLVSDSKAVRAVVKGGVEGAGFGAGAEVTKASLNGDPITVESITAGAGWGALWGGGLSGLFGKAGEVLGARKAAQRVAMEEAVKTEAAASAISEEKWGNVRGAVQDAATNMGKAVKEATSKVDAAIAEAQPERAAKAIDEAVAAKQGYLNQVVKEGATKLPGVRETMRAAQTAFSDMVKAASDGNFNALEKHSNLFGEHIKNMEGLTGIASPKLAPFISKASAVSGQAASEVTELASASKALKEMSTTAEGFAKMTPARAEKLFAGIDQFLGSKSAEFAGLQDGVKSAIGELGEHLGVTIDGSPAVQMRGIWETMRGATMRGAKETAEEVVTEGKLPWSNLGKKAVAYGVAGAAGKAAGKVAGSFGRYMAYDVAKNVAMGLLNLKGAVLGSIAKAVTDWAPRGLKVAEYAAPRLDPLKVRLDGTQDKGKGDRAALMKARAEEVRAAAPSVRDTMYKAIQGLDTHHPELAAGIHEMSVQQFSFLYDKLPKDPGSFSKLQSLANASPVDIEKWSRYYGVFQDPVGNIQSMLKTGRVTMEQVEGLREMYPSLYTEFRSQMLGKLSDPKVMDKISYQEQVHIGNLLSISLHSTMTPQFIAPQMQMYTERNQKLSAGARPGMSSGGGRPAGTDSPFASAAQKVTK